MPTVALTPGRQSEWRASNAQFPAPQEIYPPKVTEFAFVTDGACCVADILEMELLICKVRPIFSL